VAEQGLLVAFYGSGEIFYQRLANILFLAGF
jgi:hypothetical protein